MARLDGKAVLVTGAASGIGRATAAVLAGEGARVALADIDEAGGRAAADAIEGAVFDRLDVTDEAGWARVIGAAVACSDASTGWSTEPASCSPPASRTPRWRTGAASWRSISTALSSAASTASAP
jgi:NAD(P)-dependent dehydrogenase (short-subunit alcohol dehydrogenase family)